MTSSDELIGLEKARCEAISVQDIDALGAMISEDYLHVHGSGFATGKAETLDLFRQRPRIVTRGDLTVRMLTDDIEIITGPMSNNMVEPKRLIEAYTTQVVSKEGGKWRFVSFHTTFLPGQI